MGLKINNTVDPIIQCESDKVYSPSDDTFLLIDYFKKNVNNLYFDGKDLKSIRYILDMGTGTGIIAIFIKLLANKFVNFNPEIYASDILEEAIICAKNNEKLNSSENSIQYIHSDLFKSFPDKLKQKFDIIIFNPPYLPSLEIEIKETPNSVDYSWDGGKRGCELIIEFFNQVHNFLNTNHSYLLYYISSSRMDLNHIIKILETSGFQNTILVKKHIFFEDIMLNRVIFREF